MGSRLTCFMEADWTIVFWVEPKVNQFFVGVLGD